MTWDDELLIYRLNRNVNPPTIGGLENVWKHPQDAMYIPLTYSAWWGLAKLGWLDVRDPQTGCQINATPFHVANIVFHLLGVVAVYQICRELLDASWPACAGALVFAVHPLQVEPVAWATGLKDVLSGSLSLWALLVYLRFSILAEVDGRRWRYWGAATLLFVLSLLAKPSAVSVPLFALILVWLKTGRPWMRVAGPLIPWFGLSVVGVWIAACVQPTGDLHLGPGWSRPLIAADALAFYAVKFAFPFGLTIDYCRTPMRMLAQGWAYWTWILPAIMAWLICRSRAKWLFAGGGIFIAGVLPVLGLVPFRFQATSTVADRYLYLAMLGPAIVVGYMLQRVGWSGVPVLLVVVAIWIVKSFLAAGVWHDSMSLYRNAIAVHPESAVAHNNLGSVLEMHGQRQEAIAQWRIALALRPDHPNARDNLRDALSTTQALNRDASD